MEYTVQRGEAVSDEIRRVIEGRIETAIAHIDGGMDSHETVHEVRKRCKEVRAALRLVRPVLPMFNEENAHYRDAARCLSEIRDAQAAVEVYDERVRPVATDGPLDSATLDDVRAELVERRDAVATQSIVETQLKNVRDDLTEGRERVSELLVTGDGYEAVAGGLAKSYRRARDALENAYDGPDFEAFHEWRKRIGYHRDHIGLLADSWEGPMAARRAELQTLAELVGDETDLAEFTATIHDEELFDQDTREALEAVIDGRRSELRRRARPLGERLFAETAEQIAARFEQYWTATETIDHDADDLRIADNQLNTKPKPKPRPDSEGRETLPAIMREYSDRWYKPNSQQYEFTVRTPGGNRAYRKTVDGAVAVLERHYQES